MKMTLSLRSLLLPLLCTVLSPQVFGAASHGGASAWSDPASESDDGTSGLICSQLIRADVKAGLAGKMAVKSLKLSPEDIERYGKVEARKELVKRAAIKNISKIEFHPTAQGLNLVVNGSDVELRYGEQSRVDFGFGLLTLLATEAPGGDIQVRTVDNDTLDLLLSPNARAANAQIHIAYKGISFGKASLQLGCASADSDSVEERPSKDKPQTKEDEAFDEDIKSTTIRLGGIRELPAEVKRDAQGRPTLSMGLQLTYDPGTQKYYKLCQSIHHKPSSKWRCKLTRKEYSQITENGKYQVTGILLHPDDQISRSACEENTDNGVVLHYTWIPEERRISTTDGCRGRFIYMLEPVK